MVSYQKDKRHFFFKDAFENTKDFSEKIKSLGKTVLLFSLTTIGSKVMG